MSTIAPAPADGVVSELLTPEEAKYMTLGASISTITFMRGDPVAAEAVLREKFAAIVAANPWLAGSLVKGGGLHLSWPATGVTIDKLFNPNGAQRKKTKPLALASSMSYVDACTAMCGSAAEVLKGSSCINKPEEPLVTLTVVADSEKPADGFAVVFSLSHVIADGATYYKLLSMLSSTGTVEALRPARKLNFTADKLTAMGPAEHAFAYSAGFVFNIIGSMITGKKPTIVTYGLDPSRVEQAKASGKGGSGFVSTNDCLASGFGKLIGARILMVPINYRGKLTGYDGYDAGNYEGALIMGPEDFEQPAGIRSMLEAGKSTGTYTRGAGAGGGPPRKLPGFCEASRCKVAMLTNWTFDCFEELSIPGCEQIIHLPYSDVSAVPFDVVVVYRPKAKELAVAYFVRSCTPQQIVETQPVGKPLQN